LWEGELREWEVRLPAKGGERGTIEEMKRVVGKVSEHRVLHFMLVCCLGLSAWVIYLSLSIPTTYSTDGWGVAWVGFDGGMLVALVLATFAIWRKRASAIIYLTGLAAALVIDAWFDVATSKGGDFLEAILLAFLLEVPLAIFLFVVARRMLFRLTGGVSLGERKLDAFRDASTDSLGR